MHVCEELPEQSNGRNPDCHESENAMKVSRKDGWLSESMQYVKVEVSSRLL
jgi:hypothetical protein